MNRRELELFFRTLDRAAFIDGPAKSMADVDSALPIGYSQTISQPSLVLAMTQHLAPDRDSRVLEIGTGSGYQTAFLAEFSGSVYTIERIPELLDKARQRLDRMGYGNIHYRQGDGSDGWPEEAPFDRIMVTAAAGRPPDALISQLACGGRMIIPVGPRGMQELLLITRGKNNELKRASLEHVVFVELKGKYGWGGCD